MSKDNSKLILPVWPNHPILPEPPGPAEHFLGPAGDDGLVDLWGFREFDAEVKDFIKNQAPGTHEARSAQWYLDSIWADTKGRWQVQNTPDLDAQQAASSKAGCSKARMFGAGTSQWMPAQHDPMDGTPSQAIPGGAFANDNYKNGVVSWQGVDANEVLVIFRNAMTKFIRAGGIIE